MRCSAIKPTGIVAPMLPTPPKSPPLPIPISAYSNDFEVHPVAAVPYGKTEEFQWSTDLVRDGVHLPPPYHEPMPYVKTEPTPLLDTVVQDMINNAILTEDPNICAAFPLVATQLGDGTFDIIQDYSYWKINNYPNDNKYLNDSFKKLQRVSPIDQMIKLKLYHGFYQIKVHRESRKYCGVIYRDQRLAMTRLPECNALAPYILQRWAETVGTLLEDRFRVYTMIHVDEWLIHGCGMPVKDILSFLKIGLGISIDTDNSVLKPTTQLVFHGYHINAKKQDLKLTTESLETIYSWPKNIETEVISDRDRILIARFWCWVTYCHRLPSFVSAGIMLKHTPMMTYFLETYPFYERRNLKRSQRTINIFTDARGLSIATYAPEFRKGFVMHLPPWTQGEEACISAAIEGTRWALETLVADGVDLLVCVDTSITGESFVNGIPEWFANNETLMRQYVDMFTVALSRRIVWHSKHNTADWEWISSFVLNQVLGGTAGTYRSIGRVLNVIKPWANTSSMEHIHQHSSINVRDETL